MTRFARCCGLLLALLVVGCGLLGLDDPPLVVYGRVLAQWGSGDSVRDQFELFQIDARSTTCAPRECWELAIVLSGDTAYTDEHGRFRFDSVSAGSHMVYVADDYPRVWIQAVIGSDNIPYTDTLCLPATYRPGDSCGTTSVYSDWLYYAFDSARVSLGEDEVVTVDLVAEWGIVASGIFTLEEEDAISPIQGLLMEAKQEGRTDGIVDFMTDTTDMFGAYHFRAGGCGDATSLQSCSPPYYRRWVDPGGLSFKCYGPNQWFRMMGATHHICVPGGEATRDLRSVDQIGTRLGATATHR